MRKQLLFTLTLILSTTFFTLNAQNWNEIIKATATDAAASDLFGYGVDIDGDTAIIGSQNDDDDGTDSGSAYIFIRSGATWIQQAKLTALDAAATDRFGTSVSIDGDTVIVGADQRSGNGRGAAYIFTRSGTVWTQQAKLTAFDATNQDLFGNFVSISGDTVVVGSWRDDDFGVESGSAYVYVRSGTTWTLEEKLTASDAAAIDQFGYSVSLDNDTIIIGARGNTDAGPDSGSAYIFVRSGTNWTEQAKLTSLDLATGDRFGFGVSIDEDTAVIGAFQDDDDGTDSGSAYVFLRSGTNWTQQAKLTAIDAAAADLFGITVDIVGDTAIVGALNDDDNGSNSGSAYVFSRSGSNWTEQAKLTASDGAPNDIFGFNVSVDGNTVAVAAFLNDDAGTDSGSVYFFEKEIIPVIYTYSNGWLPSDPNGIATINDDIVIASGDTNINANTTSNSVTVNPGASLIIETGATLTTTNGMTLESNSTSYSSLILDGTVAGTMTYERHVNINGSGITGSNDLVSAPLTGQAFNDLAAANPNILNNGSLYLFGPFEKTTGQYVNWASTETATLDAGVGYRTGTTDNDIVTFTGTAENGTVINDIENSGPIRQEWNLVGNPYPSYLNVQDFLNHDVGGVFNFQLFDTPTAAIYGYDGSAQNGWTIYNLANTTASTLIAPGQGFFVSADAINTGLYDLEFTPAMRSTGTSDDFIQGRNAELVYLKLNLSAGSENSRTEFYFNINATQGLDVGYDAEVFQDTNLYSHLLQDNEGKAMALQALNPSDLSEVFIPLGVNANQGEQITFSISDSTLPESVSVYLDDVLANTTTLLNSGDYVITPTTNLSGTGRFFLRTSEDALSTIENSLETLNIYALNTSKEIVVSGLLKEQTNLVLYDIQGRLVFVSELDTTSLDNRIDASSLSEGVYIVSVDGNSQKKTQKIVLK